MKTLKQVVTEAVNRNKYLENRQSTMYLAFKKAVQ